MHTVCWMSLQIYIKLYVFLDILIDSICDISLSVCVPIAWVAHTMVNGVNRCKTSDAKSYTSHWKSKRGKGLWRLTCSSLFWSRAYDMFKCIVECLHIWRVLVRVLQMTWLCLCWWAMQQRIKTKCVVWLLIRNVHH